MPVELGDLSLSIFFPKEIRVVDRLAYVGGQDSLQIVDVSNPAKPVELGVLGTGEAAAIDVVGRLVYAGGRDGFHIIDVSSSATPAEVGALDVADIIDLKVEAGLAYVVGDDSARIIDVSNPREPFELGGFSDLDVHAIDVMGGLVYIAAGVDGLQIVDFGPEYIPEPSGRLLQFAALAVLGFLARMRVRRGRHPLRQRG